MITMPIKELPAGDSIGMRDKLNLVIRRLNALEKDMDEFYRRKGYER